MFGGADPTERHRVPADIEVLKNHFSRPLAWMPGQPGFEGTDWSIKNLLELKNARRVLVEGNLFEYNWPQAQNGFAILFTVRNQNGAAPWSVVEDISFSNNVIRHVANGINILGQDNNHPSQQTSRILIRNNLFDDLGGNWGQGDFIQVLDGTRDVIVERNTVLNSGDVLKSEGRPQQGFEFRGNIVSHNQYGIVGTGKAPGTATLERYFPSAVVQGNLFVGATGESYPEGNLFVNSLQEVAFVDPAAGDFRLTPGVDDSQYRGIGVDFTELCAALSPTEKITSCRDEAAHHRSETGQHARQAR
jgi:hypothetical protein